MQPDVVFWFGYGATHQSLPFAAAVLAALGSSGESGTPEAIEASKSPEAPAAPRWNEVTELIARLGELRDAGVLSEEEFQAKKTELLSRL
ncbi:SHOCT domain-containing protein [Nonomuraea fuscirosea]|uniref:SHOCT domain-containing protein n=1 Tax=Nonomuraea fuscirosea TaxID=1291556 RepID=UPI0034358423